MSRGRKIAGALCVALGFALIILLGMGVIDPTGMSPSDAATATGSLLFGLLPSALMALTVFAIGLWLLIGGKRK